MPTKISRNDTGIWRNIKYRISNNSMRYSQYSVLLIILSLLVSCVEKHTMDSKEADEVPARTLPFKELSLNSLNEFKSTTDNWRIVGDVFADRHQDRMVTSTSGTGILVNLPEKGQNNHIVTNFEHGDIELEMDVMIPKGSESGLYFQERYEVQLADSRDVQTPDFSDMGGIYQRWNGNKENDPHGFEGHSPRMNAAKAPGLWQHLRIIFHAPRFDSSGNKIQNAIFKKVWLNGELIHENVEVTGPTKASPYSDEVAMAPLLIQGDHGPVALKNVGYKLYENKDVALKNIQVQEFESTNKFLPDLDTVSIIRDVTVDTLSANMVTEKFAKKILRYSGNLIIPNSGDYIFELVVNGGASLTVSNDTLINLDGDYDSDSPGYGSIELKKGEVPFELIYNKHTPWLHGFSLSVEGPGLEKHPLQTKSSLDLTRGIPEEPILIDVNDEVITQRCFMMHKENKRTHCIAVGMPGGINYGYDLAFGSLILVWSGDFLDATQMWHSRGTHQIGEPRGFVVSLHGDPDFAYLKDENAVWPDTIPEVGTYRQLGYTIDPDGNPVFAYQVNNTTISNSLVPSDLERGLIRSITTDGTDTIWHKIAEGTSIKVNPDGTYIINNESYLIDYQSDSELKTSIRSVNGKSELVVRIPPGKHEIYYSIIW